MTRLSASHFEEHFLNNGKYMKGSVCDIKDLPRNLKITSSSKDLKTIAVWKLKFKPGFPIQKAIDE